MSISALLLAALLGAPAASAGEPDPKEKKAQIAYEAAELAYGDGKYEVALVNYQAAYDYFQDPAMLVNIAQCHRFLGRPTPAIDFFLRFLAAAPSSPYRPDIEAIIAELRALPPSSEPSPAPSKEAASIPAAPPPTEPSTPAWVLPAAAGSAGAGLLSFGFGALTLQRTLNRAEGVLAPETSARGRAIFTASMITGGILLAAAPVVFVLGRRTTPTLALTQGGATFGVARSIGGTP